MSLPGLVTSEISASVDTLKMEITPKSEWRFEVGFEDTISVKVTEGIAEIFGTELSNDIEYNFSGIKSAIYSYEGAKLEYTGNIASEYVSEETEMDSYINLHFALENYRQTNSKGPNVLILGGKDSGKTTLSKILSSYANRLGYEPIAVNLNPSDGAFSVPGTISAAPISDILDVETGWGQTYTTGPTVLHPKQPIVRYYGYDKISDNLKYYKYNVSRLGITVCSRLSEDEKIKRSGLIVDTPPMNIKDSELIRDIVSDFEINILVVIGNERLFIDLRKKFKEKIIIVKVPKSEGCVERDDTFKRKLQQKEIREYFYGTSKAVLSPFTVAVDFSVIKIFNPYVENDLISSVLPIGEEIEESDDKKDTVKLLEPTEITASSLQHTVIAITQADKTETEDIVLRSSVLGFAVVTDVDETKSRVKILIPVPGRLPDKAMIVGSFRYME